MRNKKFCIKTLGLGQKLGSFGLPEKQHIFFWPYYSSLFIIVI